MLTEGIPEDAALVFKIEEASTKKKRKRKCRSNTLGIGFGNLARTIAAQWNALDVASKGPYETIADQEKERYNKEMVVWRATQKVENEKTAPASPEGTPGERKEAPPVMPNPNNSVAVGYAYYHYPMHPNHMPNTRLPTFLQQSGPETWGAMGAQNVHRWNGGFPQEAGREHGLGRPPFSLGAPAHLPENMTPPLSRIPSQDSHPTRGTSTPPRLNVESSDNPTECWSPISLRDAGGFAELHYQLDANGIPVLPSSRPGSTTPSSLSARPQVRPRSTVLTRGRYYGGPRSVFAATVSQDSSPGYHSLLVHPEQEIPEHGAVGTDTGEQLSLLLVEGTHQASLAPPGPSGRDVVNAWSSAGGRRQGSRWPFDTTAFEPPSYWESGSTSSHQGRWFEG
jgi:hypothetical protein